MDDYIPRVARCLERLALRMDRHEYPILLPFHTDKWSYSFSHQDGTAHVNYAALLEDASDCIFVAISAGTEPDRYLAEECVHLGGINRHGAHWYADRLLQPVRKSQLLGRFVDLIESTTPVVESIIDDTCRDRLREHQRLVEQSADLIPLMEDAALMGMHLLPPPWYTMFERDPGPLLYYALGYALFNAMRHIERFRHIQCTDTGSVIGIEANPKLVTSEHGDEYRHIVEFRFYEGGNGALYGTVRIDWSSDDEQLLSNIALHLPPLIQSTRFDFKAISTFTELLIRLSNER